MKPRVKQKINLTILNLGINGEGVGKWHGYTIFVDRTLPGEVIEARFSDKGKRHGRAKLAAILNPSPQRIPPPCQAFETCGGCQIMHMSYEQQLSYKRELVVNSFAKLANLRGLPISACQPSPQQFQYRNKIQLPIVNKEGKLQIGLYERGSHELVPINSCPVHCSLGDGIFAAVKELLLQSSLAAYDTKTASGILRYLLIKTAVNTSQVLVTLVAAEWPAGAHELAQAIIALPHVTGLVVNINREPGNTVLGSEYLLLGGSESIVEELNGLRFKISSASFFQVNPYQAQRLFKRAVELGGLKGNEIVLDAFCGVGTLSLHAAKAARKVIGVEAVPEAIEDAKINASMNGIHNTEFVCALAEEYIQTLEEIDVLFVNPPRKGCEPSFLAAVCRLAPATVVYVSCDPGTLARDLLVLIEQGGYNVEVAAPYDMFPQTAHVETIVKLVKRPILAD